MAKIVSLFLLSLSPSTCHNTSLSSPPSSSASSPVNTLRHTTPHPTPFHHSFSNVLFTSLLSLRWGPSVNSPSTGPSRSSQPDPPPYIRFLPSKDFNGTTFPLMLNFIVCYLVLFSFPSRSILLCFIFAYPFHINILPVMF